MKFFRHDAIKKKVLWFTTIIIILSFGVFGTAYLIAGNSSSNAFAGSVYGKKIKMNDFAFHRKQTEIQAIMRYGDKYAEVRDYLNLDADTWNRILLVQTADKRKIKISNEEIIAAIERLPYFQRNGQFDTLIYNDVLRYVFKIKPRDYEEGMRDNLKITKVFNAETKQVSIPPDAAFAKFKTENEKTQVTYALVTPDAFVDEARYDETKARLYWVEHKKDFLIPSSINIEYLEFPLPEDEDETKNDAARAEVDQVIEQLRSGGLFAEVAQNIGKEVQQTGFFTKEDPDLSLGWSFDMLNTLFRLNETQMAGPFELDSRLVLVSLAEKKETYVPEYDQVKDDVKTAFLKEEAKDATRLKAQEYLKQIRINYVDDFVDAVETAGLGVTQTPSFKRGEYLPKIGISPAFETAAFNLTAAQRISDVVEIPTGFAILFLDEYTDASQEDFEKEKAAIEAMLLQQAQGKVFNSFLNKIRQEARIIDNISRMRQATAARQPSQVQ